MVATILVIDDDRIVRESIQQLLECEGFQTLGAANGSLGVRLATEHLPDLIVCDVQMPVMDGHQVISSLHGNMATRAIPFIFLTAKGTKLDQRQGMSLGADDYLIKPCSAKELLDAIASRLVKKEHLQFQTQQQLETLRSSLSLAFPHELRTPLTGLLTSADLLRMMANSATPTDIQEIADSIQTSVERLHRLTQNFLLYAKLEIAAHDPQSIATLKIESPEDDAVPELEIAQVATYVAQSAKRHSDLQLDLQTARVSFASSDLKKVISELVENAFKFSSSGTPVQVKSVSNGEKYLIQITNQGKGMTPEQITNVGAYIQFNRKCYEQQGTGLGLAIAKRLLELHGGSLKLISISNQFLTVEVTLPLRQG
jgi:signal transduction histidine kinase